MSLSSFEENLWISRITDFENPRKMIFGVDSVSRVGVEARELGAEKVFLVSDETIEKLGLLDKVLTPLWEEVSEVEVFKIPLKEPDMESAHKIATVVRESKCDVVVGIGGGSCLDSAKNASAMATNPGDVSEYCARIEGSVRELGERTLPKILVPTTSGTGSEASNTLVIIDEGYKTWITDNKLVFAVGPVNAVGMPGDVRFVVAGKSPLTGIWGEGNCSGFFADGLKMSRYDALMIEGSSESPVYIWINDGSVEIRDASHIWGKWTAETESIIKKEVGSKDAAVVAEGPAAENLVKYAAVIHTAHRAAGRTGLGAVMGSKKLKAIAVKGTSDIDVAYPEKVGELRKKITAETFVAYMTKTLRDHGQAGFVPDLNNDGILPTRNFRSGVFEGADNISGQAMSDTILINRESCPRCPVACKRVVEVKEGPFAPVLSEYGGPEYESVASLGSLLGIDRLGAVCRLNMLCNAYSLDTISTGVCIAFAMECYEKGLIAKKDTDGIELTFGNAEAAIKMVEKIAYRDGFGDILAEGVKRAARTIGKGSEKFAVEVKGLEIPMHEPRGKKGLGVMYAVSNRGGCHMQSMHDPDIESPNMAPEIGIKTPLHRLDTSREKVLALKKTADWTAAINSLGLCSNIYWFGAVYYRPVNLVEILNAVTGWDYTVEEFMTAGERINTYCRAFNVREGITREDDTLPPRFMEPLVGGPTEDQLITKEELDSMLNDYYEICGWDVETGIPSRERLIEIGLDFVKL